MRRELVGLGVGVLLVAFVLVLLDVGRVVAIVARTDEALFAPAMALGVAGILLLGLSLRQLRRALEPEAMDKSVRFFAAFLRAYFVRLVIPVGSSGAPAIYAYVLTREFEGSFEEELAVSTAAELLSYGASAGVALAGLAVLTVGGGEFAYTRVVTVTVGAILVGVVAAFVLLWFAPSTVDRVVLGAASAVERTAGRLSTRVAAASNREAVTEKLALFHETTSLLGRAPRTIAVCGVLSVLAWLALSAPLFLAIRSLGGTVPFALVAVAVPISGFMYVLPVSGGLGGVEVALGTLLVAGSGVGIHLAAAAVLLHRLATYWLPLVISGVVTATAAGGGPKPP
jgi:uncharacterized protein (TIRG00374 family)